MITHFSLFTGIGGIDLAAEWAGFQTIGQCEYADYPTKILEKHWPDVPRWRDIRDVTAESVRARGIKEITLISGGFPCQPFSVAGKQRGKEDDRYLWPEMCRVISELQPSWVVGENVPGIINLALDQVLADLESLNYETITFNIPACAVDAPHRRARIFIVANSIMHCNKHQKRREYEKKGGMAAQKQAQDGCPRELGRTSGLVGGRGTNTDHENCPNVADAESKLTGGLPIRKTKEKFGPFGSGKNVCNTPSEGLPNRLNRKMGGPKPLAKPQRSDWWTVEPDVGGAFDGLSPKLDGGVMDADAAETRSRKILSVLRGKIGEEVYQREIGRPGSVQEAEILQFIMCQFTQTSKELDYLPLESAKAQERLLRSMRIYQEITSSPYRPKSSKQQAREHTDIMQIMSRLLAYSRQENREKDCWTNAQIILNPWEGDWEHGIPRVATGITHRVDRLTCLGNAVVPQQVYPILAAIAEIEKEARSN